MIDSDPRVKVLKEKLQATREELKAALASAARMKVRDYAFGTVDGELKLSAMFGGRADLFVMHNMGADCPNCTMWGDGLNGFFAHVSDRAAFYVSSPDPPEEQAAFAKQRGWRFPMVSHQGTTFAADMGFAEGRRMLPGVSVFKHNGDGIVRVSANIIQPGDLLGSPVWLLLDLLPEGIDGWKPKFSYDQGAR